MELADTLVDEFDPVDFLQMLVDRLVELLGADAAGLMLADQRGSLAAHGLVRRGGARPEGLRAAAARGALPGLLRDRAARGQRGPGRGARALAGCSRPAAVAAGFRASHALPLRLRRQVLGAMNLFTAEPRRLDDEHIAIGQAMADVATIGLLHERNLREQTVLSEQLQAALHSRVLIEQAKGVLAARDRGGRRRGVRADALPRPPSRPPADRGGRRGDRRFSRGRALVGPESRAAGRVRRPSVAGLASRPADPCGVAPDPAARRSFDVQGKRGP